jgi:hypothetical protein
MNIVHEVTIILETEADRDNFRRAFRVVNSLCATALHQNEVGSGLISGGVESIAVVKRLQETAGEVLSSI